MILSDKGNWTCKDTGLPYEQINPKTGVVEYLENRQIEDEIEHENKFSFDSFDINNLLFSDQILFTPFQIIGDTNPFAIIQEDTTCMICLEYP